jgi:Flp pilus assembly pilin Flp
MTAMLLRLLADEDGQDLLEYALLATTIGLAAALAFDLIGSAIQNTYGVWEVGVNGLWESPNPGAGS